MVKKAKEKQLVIYQTKSGALELRGDLVKETVWATQAQIAEIFTIERSVVTKHIGNIFKSNTVVHSPRKSKARSICLRRRVDNVTDKSTHGL